MHGFSIMNNIFSNNLNYLTDAVFYTRIELFIIIQMFSFKLQLLGKKLNTTIIFNRSAENCCHIILI